MSTSSSSNMPITKFIKNFMLCGDLSFFCVLCKENCQDLANAEKHLRWERHRKALKSQVCLPQFKSDCIYKLDKYFYCQFCNFATQIHTEIKSHVESEAHKTYKLNPKLITARVTAKADADFVIIGNIRIKQMQWQGIVKRQCLFCNIAVTSYHCYDNDHRIKQIQARVNYVDDKFYRKIGDKFQCFSCEKAYPIHIFDDHFMNHSNNNTIGPIKAVNGIDNNDATDAKDEIVKKVISCEKMEEMHNHELDVQLLACVKDQYLDIDLELKQVVCKSCKKVLKVIPNEIHKHLQQYNYSTMENSEVLKTLYNYINKHYYVLNTDHGKARSATAQYGSVNFIKMNAGGSKGYCTLCDRFLSGSIKVFESHVKGICHQSHLELKGINKPMKRDRGSYKPLAMFPLVKSLRYSAELQSFLINGSIVIGEDSFLLMKRIEHGKHFKKTKCFACDETIAPAEEKDHCLSWKHKSNMLAAKSVSEHIFYIREIRPKFFHCCICNVSLPFWQTAYRHPTLWSHKTRLMTSISEVERCYSYFKKIYLHSDNDKLYLQLMNAVFHTKYVIKINKE